MKQVELIGQLDEAKSECIRLQACVNDAWSKIGKERGEYAGKISKLESECQQLKKNNETHAQSNKMLCDQIYNLKRTIEDITKKASNPKTSRAKQVAKKSPKMAVSRHGSRCVLVSGSK